MIKIEPLNEKDWPYTIGFLHEGTKNPYVANLVTSIARKTREDSEFGSKEAVGVIEREGLEGVISLFGHVNSADVWSGGTIRGMHHVGSYAELQNLGLRTNIHAGSSAGGVPAIFRAFDMGYGNPQTRPIDTNSAYLNDFVMNILKSIQVPKSEGKMGKVVDLLKGLSRFIKLEGIIPDNRLEDLLNKTLSTSDGTPLLMEDAPNLYLVVTHINNPREHKLVINSYDQPKEQIWRALRKSAGHVYLFKPIDEGGEIYVDGVVEGLPLKTAMNAGADIAIGFLVNYGLTDENLERINVPKVLEKVVVRWPLRIAQQIGITHIPRTLTYFDILLHKLSMQITLDNCEYLTSYNPDELSVKGDPYGRVLLVMPDLSNVSPTAFTVKTSEALITRGRNDTLRAIRDFLNPTFAHERYDPTYFSKKLIKY
ncbi:MAG: patatin-like phospholipase family protein [Nanoarchaeota archaeon]